MSDEVAPKSQLETVREFYQTFKQSEHIGVTPSIEPEAMPEARIVIKSNLIIEEAIELIEAVYGETAAKILEKAWEEAQRHDEKARKLLDAADALADIVYVVNGFAIEAGIPLDDVFDQVHLSNMSKLDDNNEPIISDGVTPSEYDGKVKPINKILKSKNFFEPEPKIEEILRAHGAKL